MASSTAAQHAPGKLVRLPGNTGIWVFLSFDLVFFGLFFFAFVTDRAGNIELFDNSQKTLNFELGLVNTLILLTSSWFVALAIEAAREGRGKWVPRLLMLATACGLGFVAIKAFEYGAKFSAGISMMTDKFFSYYFLITGIHLAHVVIGMVVLTIVAAKARRGAYPPERMQGLEMAALYWHLVDLLWVMLFPLIYLSSAL